MATSHRPGARAGPSVRAPLLVVLLTALLGAGLPAPDRRAAAQNPAPADVVAAATAAYGSVGTFAMVVGKQQRPAPAASIAAAEARSARIAARSADNGLADRPFPAASMVKLFMAEDILHRARGGRLTLTRDDFVLLQDMIRRSDDPAASAM